MFHYHPCLGIQIKKYSQILMKPFLILSLFLLSSSEASESALVGHLSRHKGPVSFPPHFSSVLGLLDVGHLGRDWVLI